MVLHDDFLARRRSRLLLWHASLLFLLGCSGGGSGEGQTTAQVPDTGSGGTTAELGSGGQDDSSMTNAGGALSVGSGGEQGGAAPGSGGLGSNSGGAGPIGSAGGSGGQGSSLPLILQEEGPGFCRVSGVIESTNTGFTGTGYANTDNFEGALIDWRLTADSGGEVPARIVYSSGSGNRVGVISVNGQPVATQVQFSATADFKSWSEVAVQLPLVEGDNLITLTAMGPDGLPNVDFIELSAVGLDGVDCAETMDLPPVTVYIAGDSTVSTYSDTASPSDQAGWGQMLHEIFDDKVTVENRAMGGRTALWFALEGGAAWVLDRIEPGDYFFVQFGTNDSHTTAEFVVDGKTYKRFAEAGTTFKEHLLEYYIEPTRAKAATPVLVTPPPRNSAYCGTGNSLGGYAQAMRELGEAEDVLVLDNNQRTFDHLAAICPAKVMEDFFFVRTDSTVDGTHFQENGARHMARFIGQEMDRQSAGPYRYLVH